MSTHSRHWFVSLWLNIAVISNLLVGILWFLFPDEMQPQNNHLVEVASVSSLTSDRVDPSLTVSLTAKGVNDDIIEKQKIENGTDSILNKKTNKVSSSVSRNQPESKKVSVTFHWTDFIFLFMGLIGILNFVFSILLLSNVKWGFWGTVVTSIFIFYFNMKMGAEFPRVLGGLLGVPILFLILQIKKDGRSAWSWLR